MILARHSKNKKKTIFFCVFSQIWKFVYKQIVPYQAALVVNVDTLCFHESVHVHVHVQLNRYCTQDWVVQLANETEL